MVLLGPPNTGKSSLLKSLTKAEPEVSELPFSSKGPTPGMMQIEDIQIQLIDTPPLYQGYQDPEMLNLLRKADLIVLILDLQAGPSLQLEQSLELLRKHRILPKQFQDKEALQEAFFWIPFLILVNKLDHKDLEEDFEILKEITEQPDLLLPISILKNWNLERLKANIFQLLQIIRIYSKAPGKEADMSQPFVLKKGSTIQEFAEKLHKDFAKGLKSARIWGEKVYEGQMVGREHVLEDKDVVELRS